MSVTCVLGAQDANRSGVLGLSIQKKLIFAKTFRGRGTEMSAEEKTARLVPMLAKI